MTAMSASRLARSRVISARRNDGMPTKGQLTRDSGPRYAGRAHAPLRSEGLAWRQEVENQVARQARGPTTPVEVRRDFDHIQRHNAWLTCQHGHGVSELCRRESTNYRRTDAWRVRAVGHVHAARNVTRVRIRT